MLLVDHDQADVRERGEHGRAWPDAHPGLAAGQAQPLVVALPGAHARVHHRDDVSEAGLESRECLWSQRDLRDEDDHAPARLQRRFCAAWRYTSVLPEPVTP